MEAPPQSYNTFREHYVYPPPIAPSYGTISASNRAILGPRGHPAAFFSKQYYIVLSDKTKIVLFLFKITNNRFPKTIHEDRRCSGSRNVILLSQLSIVIEYNHFH